MSLLDNTINDNIVIGPDLGLIYAKNTIIYASGNKIKNNGYLSD